MKILKHGTPQKVKRIFCCSNCGCEFEAEDTEYETITHGHIDGSLSNRYFCQCPECFDMAREKDD